jgi:hypothetical protein
MAEEEQKVKFNKVQQEVQNLVERRLKKVREFDSLKKDREGVNAEMKECQKEFTLIDNTLQEKMDELNKLRV